MYIYMVTMLLSHSYYIPLSLFTSARSLVTLKSAARSVPGKSFAPSTIIAMKSVPHHRMGTWARGATGWWSSICSITIVWYSIL